MKKLLPILLMISCFALNAQERYQDEIFSEVTVTSDVTYGTNISIISIILGASETPLPEDMKMDIYEPVGDDATERPVVIITHRGDFLPAVAVSYTHLTLPTTPYV